MSSDIEERRQRLREAAEQFESWRAERDRLICEVRDGSRLSWRDIGADAKLSDVGAKNAYERWKAADVG